MEGNCDVDATAFWDNLAFSALPLIGGAERPVSAGGPALAFSEISSIGGVGGKSLLSLSKRAGEGDPWSPSSSGGRGFTSGEDPLGCCCARRRQRGKEKK